VGGVSGEQGKILVFWSVTGTAFVGVGDYTEVGNRASGTREVELS